MPWNHIATAKSGGDVARDVSLVLRHPHELAADLAGFIGGRVNVAPLPGFEIGMCASDGVAEPFIGLTRSPLNGTRTPAFAPGAAGPWIWAAVAGPPSPDTWPSRSASC